MLDLNSAIEKNTGDVDFELDIRITVSDAREESVVPDTISLWGWTCANSCWITFGP